MESLFHSTHTARIKNAVTAGASDIADAAVVDMKNYEGVMFIAAFGAIASSAVTGIEARQSDAVDMSSAETLAGASVSVAADSDNKLAVIDIKNPGKRYIRCAVKRKTANSALDSLIAIRYGPRKKPTSADATVAAAAVVSGPAAAE